MISTIANGSGRKTAGSKSSSRFIGEMKDLMQPDRILGRLEELAASQNLMRTSRILSGARKTANFMSFYLNQDGFFRSRETDPIVVVDFPQEQLHIYNHPSLFRLAMLDPVYRMYYGTVMTRPIQELVGEHATAAQPEGPLHKAARKDMNPLMHGQAIDSMKEIIERNAQKAAWELTYLVDKGPYDINEIIKAYTIANLADAILGASIDGNIEVIRKAAERSFSALYAKILMPPSISEIISLGFEESREKLHLISDRAITEKLESGAWKNGTDVVSGLIRLMYVEGLDEIERERRTKRLKDETFGLFLGGHDTTASAISFMCHLIQKYPDQYLQLFRSYARGGEENPESEFSRRIKAWEMEVLRFQPVAGAIARRVMKTHTLDFEELPSEIQGMKITEGALVMFSNLGRQRNQTVYGPDAEEFDHSRFMSEDMIRKAMASAAYTPFGGGAHTCLGNELAKTQIKQFLRALVRNDLYIGMPSSLDYSPSVSAKAVRKITELDARVQHASNFFG